MSLNAPPIDGMPPWWSPSSLAPFMASLASLKKPIVVAPLAVEGAARCGARGLPALDDRLGRRVGVVLDGDRLTLRDALHLEREHALLDHRLVRVAARGPDAHVELVPGRAAHVGRADGAELVDHPGRLDADLADVVDLL